MNTKRLFSNLAGAGMRMMVLLSMLITALTGNVASAYALPLSLQTVTVSTQSGTLNTGTAGSVTYSVTVTRSNGTPNTTTMTISGLPTGATGSFFDESAWSPSSGTGTRTYTLTVDVTAAAAVGSYVFTVQASGQGPDPTGTGILTIDKANQTITFNTTDTDKTLGIPDFDVSATASSGLPVSFAADGLNCSNSGSLVHLISLGSCTIAASQAGDATYAPAPDAMLTFDIVAPATACTPTVTKELWAKTGSATLYGTTSVTIWGYSDTVDGDASLPGPVLEVNEGDCVGITLHNVDIPENTSLLLEGQNMIPDRVGAASSGDASYIFSADNAGTFLYEAGLVANGQHQVAMGMYGALIVHPTTPDPAIAQEQVLVLSEVDPALNNGSPAAFDMRDYNPSYFLINGKAYPDTDPIPANAGDTILLRYVNAGMQAHSMSTLGLLQTLIAQDGFTNTSSHKMVAETIATGQTLDTLVTIPASAQTDEKYAVYDANMLLHNTTDAGFGGMMTFLTVGTATPPPPTGPITSGETLSPNPTNGSVDVAIKASVSDVSTGGSNIDQAEYCIDSMSACLSMSGTFGGSTVTVNATLTVADLALLASGNHTIYVHGHDSADWGPFTSAVLNLDKAGPATSALVLSPNPTNGTADVNLIGSASDVSSGNSDIIAAQYNIDGGSTVAMNVNTTAPTAALSATITASTVNALSEGTHTIAVRSQDALDNWGDPANITLTVDKTGPSTSDVSASPNPNNGSKPYSTSIPAVRVFATFTDGLSNVAAGEGFIDCDPPGTVSNPCAIGSGFVFIANDGNFNSLSEPGYVDIPLAVVNTLSNGNHPLCIHGRDAAGTWGATDCSYQLMIDKVAPTVVSINRLDANPLSAASVNWLVTFSESVTGVSAANFSLVQGGGLTGAAIASVTGSGATRTVTASTGSGGGTLGLNLTSATGITDVAGNALSSTGLPFVGQVYTLLTPPLYFSTFGNTNPPGVGGTADDADIYFWDGAAFSRVINVATSGGGDTANITNALPTGANVDGFDRVDATHFYMSFNGNVTVPGLGSVADEDVVYYNAGTWLLFFDGSTHCLGGGGGCPNTDLDAISIVGGTLYFSTDDTAVPPGVSGGGDDADIYSWNGTSFSRAYDASVLGWSTANVDGFVRVDATHYYLSYSADTSITGLGSFQDEDVVYNNAGVWSVYFDGTSKGLNTSGNLDVDAFDIP